MSRNSSPCMGHTEVSPYNAISSSWKELSLNTGATLSTLQDFKLPEFAGGFAYGESDSWQSPSSNRFIYWKASKDIIEFTELSTDLTLVTNQLRLRFQNTPLLEGVSVNETNENVVILVATVASVHRLVFPHPKRLGFAARGLENSNPFARTSKPKVDTSTKPSIFHSYSQEDLADKRNHQVVNNSFTLGSGASSSPTACCSWLTTTGEGVYVFAQSSGALLIAKMGSINQGGKVTTHELRQASFTEKMKTFLPSIMRSQQEGEDALSLECHRFEQTTLIFALCRDAKIRVWSFDRQECILVQDVQISGNQNLESLSSSRRPLLRKAVVGNHLYLTSFFNVNERAEFVVLQVNTSPQFSLDIVSSVQANYTDELLDFGILQDELWSLWLNSKLEMKVSYTSYGG